MSNKANFIKNLQNYLKAIEFYDEFSLVASGINKQYLQDLKLLLLIDFHKQSPRAHSFFYSTVNVEFFNWRHKTFTVRDKTKK